LTYASRNWAASTHGVVIIPLTRSPETQDHATRNWTKVEEEGQEEDDRVEIREGKDR